MTTEESYPQYLCIDCVHQLTLTHSFKYLIESSLKTLAKVEIEDTNSNGEDCNWDFNIDLSNITYTEEDEEKRLFCVECKTEFNTGKLLREHCTLNHPVRSQTGRECNYCDEKFEDYRELVKHRKLHLKPYFCQNCWTGFFKEKNLNSHTCIERQSTEIETKLQQCDQCGKSYPRGYIKIHLLTHSDNRKYSCKYCPKKFKVPCSLNSHVLWNHKRTRDYKCEVCEATFISASARSTHIRKHHLKEKKHVCEQCGKRFFGRHDLQRHMLTHTGVKNYHCELCDKSYQTRFGLNVHMKSHTNMAQSQES